MTPSRGFGSDHSSHSRCASSPAREADQVGVAPVVDHLGELAHVGADRQVGVIDAAELVGVGVDVDQRLAGMVGRDQRVAVGGRLAEPRRRRRAAGRRRGCAAAAWGWGRSRAGRHRRRSCWRSRPGGGRRRRRGCRGGRRNWRNDARRAGSSRRRRRSRPGRRLPSAARTGPAIAPGSGASASGGTRGRSSASTSSRSMSSGSASTTGPGRPAVATR